MNFNTWNRVRHQVYHCFGRSADALFELADALTGEAAARTLPELSLSAPFRRKWPSVYEALEDGRIDQTQWSRVWTAALLAQHEAEVWVSIDSTSIPRPQAETSADRGMIYVPNLPHAKKPVSVGWHFSTVMLLPTTKSSWGAILDQRRIASEQTAVEVAVQQLESLLALLPREVRVLADRWYVTGPFVQACQRLCIGALLRLKRNRKLYRPGQYLSRWWIIHPSCLTRLTDTLDGPYSHEMRNEVNSSAKLFSEAVCKAFRSQVTRKKGRERLCEHGEAIE